MRRASRVILRNKSFKPKVHGRTPKLKDLQAMKALTKKTHMDPRHSKGKNKPPSVSAQFNYSLQQLMDTLNQANPFFIRCIKSNANKAPIRFDEGLVLRQLRYTGMLATVKIRRSGYNYRLTFEEFIQIYKLLLPQGLLSSRKDIEHFLQNLDLNRDNYQIGKTKVFLREKEKQILDETLHQAIMRCITKIQFWARGRLERQRYLRLKKATLVIQTNSRRLLSQRKLEMMRLQFYATILIQKVFRGYRQRKKLLVENRSALQIQKMFRGHRARERVKFLREEREERRRRERELEEERKRMEEQQAKEREQKLAEEAKRRLEEEERQRAIIEARERAEATDRWRREHRLRMQEERRRREEEQVRVDEEEKLRMEEEERRRLLRQQAAYSLPKGILNRDSTDDLSSERDIETVRAHDSEESSVILDDSESDLPSLDTSGRKSRGSSLASPPSTPSSPLVRGTDTYSPHEQLNESMDIPWAVKYRTRPLTRYPPTKYHSVACMPQYRTQQGPRDIEIHIRPAMTKANSDEFLDNYEVDRATWKQKQIAAPLAKQESLTDTPLEDKLKVVRRLTIDDATLAEKEGEDDDKGTAEDSKSETSHKSPFYRAKKHIKNIMGDGAPLSPGKKKPKEAWVSTGQEPGNRNKKHRRKGSKKRKMDDKVAPSNAQTWSVSATSQWQYPTDQLVTNPTELRQLQEFVYSKLTGIRKTDDTRDTIFDAVFKYALNEIHVVLITQVSIALQDGKVEMSYKDVMSIFEGILRGKAHQEGKTDETFPVTMGINAFRGFLDEFHKRKPKELAEVKPKKEKKKKPRDRNRDGIMEQNGHHFQLIQFSIPTYCEHCASLIWMMEKGLVCTLCKYTVHKKCCTKSAVRCKGTSGLCTGSSLNPVEGRVFGVPLCFLVREGHKVPTVVERLINAIEINGLYTVGIYRKAGHAAKVRQLTQAINQDANSVDFNDYQIHVLSSVMKQFLRSMPDPLMTFELYDDFIRIAEMVNEKERCLALYSVIDKLPQPHHDLLERVMFHLAKIIQHESSNKMSANGIAIIFAPGILRTNRSMPAQESLNHVPKQTLCIQCIVMEQVRKFNAQISDIKTLESATVTASDRLSVVRASIRGHQQAAIGQTIVEDDTLSKIVKDEKEEKLLSKQLKSLQKEKEALTLGLPTLECRLSSSEEEMLSTDDVESTADERELHEYDD